MKTKGLLINTCDSDFTLEKETLSERVKSAIVKNNIRLYAVNCSSVLRKGGREEDEGFFLHACAFVLLGDTSKQLMVHLAR